MKYDIDKRWKELIRRSTYYITIADLIAGKYICINLFETIKP